MTTTNKGWQYAIIKDVDADGVTYWAVGNKGALRQPNNLILNDLSVVCGSKWYARWRVYKWKRNDMGRSVVWKSSDSL